MKKLLSWLLLLALCLSLSGCITTKVKDDNESEEESTKAAVVIKKPSDATQSAKATASTEITKPKTESTKATKTSDPTKATERIEPTKNTESTKSTEPVKPTTGKKNYTVSDAELEKKKDVVIAKIGDQALTNEQLQVYYWMAVREYVSQSNAALSYGQAVERGFDPAKPLDEQIYDAKAGKTWQQFFLETALETWNRYACLAQKAKDDGYKLSQEIQSYLDAFDEDMAALAQDAGYTDVENLIDAQISKGASAAAYYYYTEMQYIALGYLEAQEKALTPTDKELEDYYTAHKAELEANGYGKDAGKYYDVRHIFITLGENGRDYSADEWEACLTQAQQMLNNFLANDPTEEKFAELAKKHSEDPGSATNGGLYSYLTKNYGFIKEFEDWYVDESRKPGDTGIVKNTGSSKVGYHIMYFSGSEEIWKGEAETGVLTEKMQKILEDAKVKYPITVEYKKIALGSADLTTD